MAELWAAALPLSLASVAVVLFGGNLYVRQRSLVFRPSPTWLAPPADFQMACQDVFLLTSAGEQVHSWWAPGRNPRKAIVCFHGSDGNVSYEVNTLRFLSSFGASVLIVDYPGYGRSGGTPSEQGCYRAAEAAWTLVTQTMHVRPADVIVYGYSLGSAVAMYLASSRACGGLVFHAGFTSVPDMAARAYPYLPVRLFCRTRMDSLRRVANCRAPLLVLHSDDDEHVPVAQARRVYARARGPKRFVRINGKHHGDLWQTTPGVRTAFNELLDGSSGTWETADA